MLRERVKFAWAPVVLGREEKTVWLRFYRSFQQLRYGGEIQWYIPGLGLFQLDRKHWVEYYTELFTFKKKKPNEVQGK